MIDSQVHFREPGATHKEDLETGSRGAALGGVTAVFEMPNTDPLTTSAAALEDKLARAKGRMHCDYAFWVGGTHDNVADLPELERLPGAAGSRCSWAPRPARCWSRTTPGVLEILQADPPPRRLPCEDEARLSERKALRVAGDPASHPVWRDEIAALRCTRAPDRSGAAGARARACAAYFDAEEIDFLQGAKDVATCEVTPQHLTLTADDYARLGTKLQMNPPVRDAAHRDGVWRGVAQGIVDVLGSDHAPHTLDEKAKPYPDSPSGMTGVQTLVPIMLDHVAAGRLTLAALRRSHQRRPARIFGIAGKGRIAAGYDADFTIVDLKRRETISDGWIASRAGWTPYNGKQVTGWPIGTIVRGKRVMWEGELTTPAQGAAVRFHEAL